MARFITEKPQLEKGPKEIERKFLVKSLPENLEQYSSKEITQGYIAVSEDGTEIRLRKKGDKHFQTVKSGGGKVRTEVEIEITKEQFDSLWGTTEGKRIEKIRYVIPHEGAKIELDVYHGKLEGLTTVEVEFDSVEASDGFDPPEWFGREVTEDRKYKNQSLAIYGIPAESTDK